MQPIQFILIFFLIFAISRVYLRAKEGTLSLGEIMFWSGIFLVAVVGVIDTRFLQFVAQKVGIGRGADIAIYISIVLLFYLIFRTNVLIENMRHEITKLTRHIAMLESQLTPQSQKSTKNPKPAKRKT